MSLIKCPECETELASSFSKWPARGLGTMKEGDENRQS